MSESMSVLKDETHELPVPLIWRDTLRKIVEAFKEDDFTLSSGIANVKPISLKEASRFRGNIEEYGDTLVSLPSDAWKTSIYRWNHGTWDVLVDLYTSDEGASDLVMFVQVKERDDGYGFEVESVNVP